VLFDKDAPRSLASLLPEAFMIQVRALYDSDDGYLLGSVEYALRRELTRRQKPPTPIDCRLRMQFWFEYFKMMGMDKCPTMSMPHILGTVISKESFYKYYIQDHCKLAWLLCPPQSYTQRLEDAISYSLDRIWDILSLPLEKENGEPNLPLIKEFMKLSKHMIETFKMLDRDENTPRVGPPGSSPRNKKSPLGGGGGEEETVSGGDVNAEVTEADLERARLELEQMQSEEPIE
jgi:hypothetical protein